jgi:putative membrane protein
LKPPEPGTWRRTSPLAILFFLGKLFRDIAKNAWQSFAPIAALLIASSGNIMDRLMIGALVALILVIVASVLRYWFFRFRITEDSVLIREGVVKKKQLDIKFDRIQGINVEQNIVYRYLDLVTVSFDTAGSSADEGNLPAVPKAFAEALREKIGRPLGRAGAEDSTENTADSGPLLALDWRDMVRIGLSNRRVLLILALLSPLLDRLGDDADTVVSSYIDSATQEAMQFGVVSGVPLFVAIGIGVILLFALVSIAAAFLRYHNFTLHLDGSTLRSRGGLLTRHEVSMDLGKIQTLRLQQGIILRGFNRFVMTARQARSSHKNDSSKNFTIPVVTPDLATSLRRRFLQQEGRGLEQIPTSSHFNAISTYSMRIPVLVNVLIPILVTAITYPIEGDRATLLFLLWIPISLLHIFKTWQHAGFHYTDDGLVRRSGTLGYRTVALLYRKVQRVTVSRSPLQRRKGLATLRVYMASGSVRIPYIDHELARQLRDVILYKVESSQKAWH